MRKWSVLLTVLILAGFGARSAQAQDNTKVPSWEVGGGYTYRNYAFGNIDQGPTRVSMNGWGVMMDYMIFKKWLSVAAQADGTYSNTIYSTQVYSAMAGPQFYPFGHRRLTVYAHVLFGEGFAHFVVPASGGFPSLGESSHAYAWQGGGGVDYAWKPHWTIRLIQADYEDTRFFGATPSQSNLKITVGVMYRFGKLKRGR